MQRTLLAVVGALLLTSCGSGGPGVRSGTAGSLGGSSTETSSEVTTSSDAPVDPIAWDACGDGLDCGTLDVPVSYDDPSLGTMRLALVRHRATDPDERIGSLLVNPGGPGASGTFLAEFAPQIYGSAVLEHFDVVAFDPRGTGASEPAVDCTDEYDPYFALDMTPETAAEEQALDDAAAEFTAGCLARSGEELLANISTEAAARDLDTIRRALGEATISYFGFSYGSELGATWATLFPTTVRAAVLDGAVDPTTSDFEETVQQAGGFEQALEEFLAWCGDDRDCRFADDAEPGASLDALLAELDERPLASAAGRAPVNAAVALTAIANAMYSDDLWPALAEALADARSGDGAGLLRGYDEYFERAEDGTYSNLLEAFVAITCLDRDPDDPFYDDSMEAELRAVAPRLWPSFAGDGFCSVWPVPSVGRVAVNAAGAGPVLVVGTTGDAATPISATRAMADALEEGVLLVVDANQHTGYTANDCAQETVDRYLVELEVPEPDATC